MIDWQDLKDKLDNDAGIDGGKPESRFWFIGLEYGERGKNNNVKGDWWEWNDRYYSNIKAILDTIRPGLYQNAYLANLYPKRSQNMSKYGNDYFAFCDLHGRRFIRENLKIGEKKIIVCFGLSYQWDFMLQLSEGHSAEFVKTNRHQKFIEIKFSDHPNIDRLIIIRHISRAGKAYCQSIGEHIKTINQNKLSKI
ncbi:MAG: hypothetical protein FWC61_04640 [Proteobacteria bacterium]|nr:hypothetical protein [Pseudomonadota bacterium]